MTPKELAKHLREGLLHGTNKFISEREHMPMVIAALEAYEPWVWTKNLVTEQAEDPGLWFPATTASEAYLQQALRRLHLTVELPMKPKPPEEK